MLNVSDRIQIAIGFYIEFYRGQEDRKNNSKQFQLPKEILRHNRSLVWSQFLNFILVMKIFECKVGVTKVE